MAVSALTRVVSSEEAPPIIINGADALDDDAFGLERMLCDDHIPHRGPPPTIGVWIQEDVVSRAQGGAHGVAAHHEMLTATEQPIEPLRPPSL